MKIPALAIAAAIAMGMIGAAPAAAQPGHNRTVVTHTRTVEVHRANWHDNRRHNRWHHRRRVCRNVWRHHRHVRTCTVRRW